MRVISFRKIPAILALLSVPCGRSLAAETGREGWLRYAPVGQSGVAQARGGPATILATGDSLLLRSAHEELVRGFEHLLGPGWPGSDKLPALILLGTAARLAAQHPPSG